MKKFAVIIVVSMLVLTLVPVTGQVECSSISDLPISAGGFKLNSISGESLRLEFSMNADDLINFKGKLFYEDMSLSQVIGMPQIPLITKRIHLKERQPLSVSIRSVKWETLPVPKLDRYYPRTWNDELRAEEDQPWIGKFPNNIGDFKVEVGSDGYWLTLMVTPVSIDFDSDEMIVFTHIELDVAYSVETKYSLSSLSEDDDTEKAIILCPNILRSSAESLAVLQRNDGYVVEVITVDEIESTYSPQEEEPEDLTGYTEFSKSQKESLELYDYDLARSIRSCLEAKMEDVAYVTIMGDGELVPPSFYYLNPMSYYEYDQFVPTDLFYASPDLDSIPNIALGRLPVRNVEEADIVVDKLSRYRKALTEGDWFHSINLAGGDPFNGGFDGEIECQSLIDIGMLDGFEVEKYYKTRERFSSEDVIEAIDDEVGFVYTINHGSGEALATEPGKVTTEDILAMPLKDRLPIILTPACSNGMYDSTVVDHELDEYEGGKGMSFAQACIASPGGPIAYYGGSRLNYAGVNWTIEGGVVKILPFDETDRILQEVMNAYYNWAPTLGEMTVQAYKKYIGVDGGGYSFFGTGSKTLMAFVFFGDPTIRLPETPGGSPHRIPEIEMVDAGMRSMGYSMGEVPALSIVESNELKITTDQPWIKYSILNLDYDVKVVSDWQKIDPNDKRLFEIEISPQDKSYWQARLELPNLSEVWIYYISAADNDLSVDTSREFFITKPKPRQHFTFSIINDGLKTAEDIEVDFYIDDSKIKTRLIDELESGYGQYVYFKADSVDIGEHDIRVETSFAVNDQYPDDNEYNRKLIITEDETCKTACLVSYFYPSTKAKEEFAQEEFNEKVQEFDNKPTELAFVGSDSYWAVMFGYPLPDLVELGADSVILPDPNCVNPYTSNTTEALSDFAESGGSIVGTGCLYDADLAPLYSMLFDWFGFDPDVGVSVTSVEGNSLEKIKDDSSFFDGGLESPLALNTVYMNEPDSDSWDEMIIDENTVVHAISADGKDVLCTNTQHVYLSSRIDVESDSELRFLYNLLAYNLRPRSDAMISLSGIESDPPLPTVSEDMNIRVIVDNAGNTELNDVKVSVEELDLQETITSIAKGESGEVVFAMTAPDSVGIMTITPRVSVENDIDPDNDSTTLRIRIRETKQDSDIEIEQLNVAEGNILPWERFTLIGKTEPNTFLNANGNIGRADGSGRFMIPFEPSSDSVISIHTNTPSGENGISNVPCAFEKGGSIGCMLDVSYFIASTNFVKKTTVPVLKIIEENTYINIEEVSEYLGLDFEGNTDNWILRGSVVAFEYDAETNLITKSIGDWTDEIQAKSKIIDDGGIYIPLEMLSKLSFNVDYDKESYSLVLQFPKKKDHIIYATNSVTSEYQGNDLEIPSETNYGKPNLVSFGPLDGEVASLTSFQVTSKKLYIWTYRGIQEWTKDGEFIGVRGFPSTLAEDLDVSWGSLYHASSGSYYGPYIKFFITSTGGLMVLTSERLAIYDREWNMINVVEFDDEMDVDSAQVDNDSNLFIFDVYTNCYVYSDSGEMMSDFELIDADDQRISSPRLTSVTPDGNLIVVKAEYSYSFYRAPNWDIYKYDSHGQIVTEKRFETDEDEESDEELPAIPSYVLPDVDGTYWLIEASWRNSTIRHWDSDFEELDVQNVDVNFRSVIDMQMSDDGRVFLSGSFTKKEDSISRLFAMMTLDYEFNEEYLVPSADTDGKDRFYYPSYLFYDPDGNLVAINRTEIRKYDKMGSCVEDIMFKDDKGEILSVEWLLYGSENVYGIEVNYNSRAIVIADEEYKTVKSLPLVVEETEDKDEFMLYPRNLAVDEDRNEIFVLDMYETDVIQVIPNYLDTEEDIEKINVKRSFAPRGIGEGKINSPKYLRKFGNKLFILDYDAKKIVTYNTDGEFLFEFGGEGDAPGKMIRPYSMSIDENGLIWIVDAEMSKLLVFDDNGTYITSIGSEGNLKPPGTIEAYREDPFSLLFPTEACANAGQITIFDYCHNRIIMLNSLKGTMNLNLLPEKPVLSMWNTQSTATSELVITNTGPGMLEGTLSCEDENLVIEPSKLEGNFTTVQLTYNTGEEISPEFVFLKIESNVGTSSVKVPIRMRNIDFTLRLGSQVAVGAEGVMRLTTKPAELDGDCFVSTGDLEHLIPMIGVLSNAGNTLNYTVRDRGIEFVAGSDVAELRIGEDSFRLHLPGPVKRATDNSFIVPLDVVASFISCDIITEDETYKVVTRN